MASKKTNKKDYIYSVGRRRTAAARVRLFKGKGENTVNGKPIGDYFPGAIKKDVWAKPFRVVEASGEYHATVRVVGGGKNGQLDAVAHGIAKALAEVNKQEFRKPLKAAGLLTRDPRVKERRKIGTGGKARRKKQSPKR